jgi:hypothetical protein
MVAIKNLVKSTLILGGKIIAGAESVKCDWEEAERYTSYVDTHGSSTITKNPNNNMIIDIEISESSSGNDVLSLYYNLHQASDTGFFPLIYKDENGATIISSAKAQVWKTAALEYKKEHVLRTWQIYALDASYFVGGIKQS